MAIIARGHYTITDLTDGIGIASTIVWYYNSTSRTELTGGEWQKEAPQWENGKYIWTKTIVTYDDDDATTQESKPVCITGNHGDDGVGIVSVTALYCLSDSNKSTDLPPATSELWKTEPDPWAMGKYMWTRTKIEYTEGEPMYTEPYCDSGWEAIDKLVIGGRNYIQYSKTMYWYGHHVLRVIGYGMVDLALVDVSLVG